MASEAPAEVVKHRRYYDLSMSRRTRKPKIVAEASSPDRDEEVPVPPVDAHRSSSSSSLKELMNETGKAKEPGGSLALARRRGDGAGAAGMGGMVSKCVKVLSHLVKAKRDSKKKSAAVRQLKP